MADQEEDFSSLPLQDRWTHKNWKVRKEAYEAAARDFKKAVDENDDAVRMFTQDPGLWKAAVADSNVAAQQEAMSSLCAWLDIAGAQGCSRTRSLTIPLLAEKGLAATRPAAKQHALEAILLSIEVDKVDPVIEELMPILSHKQPKVIAATLMCLREIYHAYGCKTADPKPVLKALPKAFGHADKNVRAETQNLAVELYRWLRDSMKPFFFNDLKPVQQQDLEKLFEGVKNDPPPKQARLLRSQQEIVESVAASGGQGEEAYEDNDDQGVVFEEPELEAIDVTGRIPKNLLDQLASTKWKDRKDSLDELLQVLRNTPRIQEGSFDDIMRALAKCMKDSNVAVVSAAANSIELFARGLKRTFSKYKPTVFVPMLERLKEKKQAVTDAIGAALDAVFLSTGLSEILEEVLEKLKDKNPQIKLESTRFLARCLRETRDVPSQEQAKSIAAASIKLLTESQEVQRTAGAEVLGTLWKIMGDRAMAQYMEGIEEIRKAKIKEFFDSAEVKAKSKPKPAASAPGKAPGAPGQAQKRMGMVGTPGPKRTAAPAIKRAATTGTALQYEELTPAPAAQRPAGGLARPGMSKLGPPKSGLTQPGGLRAPAGLQKKMPGPGTSSPVRRVASPVEDAAPIQPPKLGMTPGRGLTGRPLGKPTSAQSYSAEMNPAPMTGLSGFGAAERAELDELHAETERLRRENEMLRADRAKMSSQIHELTNQNAQLIEDHTRDVLSIKAKETQLVRARSDHEAAESQVQAQQREMDRLKRELSRQVRAASPPPVDLTEQIYNDGGATSDIANGATTTAYSRTQRQYMTSPTSEGLAGGPFGAGVADHGTSSPRPKLSSSRTEGQMPRSYTASTITGTNGSAAGGAESWKRAAEVTQSLKARIEMMKAKQGLSRPTG